MTVASIPSVQWRTLSIEESVEGQSSLIHLEVTNTGNTVIGEKVIVDTLQVGLQKFKSPH